MAGCCEYYLGSEPSSCGSAPGLSPAKQDRFVFSYSVPCVRLSSDHWLLWGEVKGMALTRNFFMGFDFRVNRSSSWFLPIKFWVFWLAGPGAGGPVYNLFRPRGLRWCPVYVLRYNFFFRFFLFLNWSFDYVHGNPRRLPSLSLERSRYEVTSP